MHRQYLPLIALLFLVFATLTLACQSSSSSSTAHHAEPTPADDDDDDDDASPGADDDDDASPGVPRAFEVTLELRNTGRIVWTENGDDLLNATVRFGKGDGDDLVTPGLKMNASGKIMRFPEAKTEIHTLKFGGPAIPSGPCGNQPIQYGLSLTGQEGAAERQGGIGVYCGNTISGAPVRVLRVATVWGTPE